MALRNTYDLGGAPIPGAAFGQLFGSSKEPDGAAPSEDKPDQQGAFQVARFDPLEGLKEKADEAARALARKRFRDNPQQKENLRGNLRSIFGASFTDAEMEELANGLLDRASATDLITLSTLRGSQPQFITGDQKSTVERIMGALPNTSLNSRAIGEYRRALRDGRIRVR